jgi:hypothetical protein
VTTARENEQRQDGLRVVFCGGCNPAIDRVGVAEDVRAAAGEQPVTLYVSGCQRACASGHRLVSVAGEAAVVVAGEQVEAVPTAATEIVAAVVEKLGSSRGGHARGGTDRKQSSAGE